VGTTPTSRDGRPVQVSRTRATAHQGARLHAGPRRGPTRARVQMHWWPLSCGDGQDHV